MYLNYVLSVLTYILKLNPFYKFDQKILLIIVVNVAFFNLIKVSIDLVDKEFDILGVIFINYMVFHLYACEEKGEFPSHLLISMSPDVVPLFGNNYGDIENIFFSFIDFRFLLVT